MASSVLELYTAPTIEPVTVNDISDHILVEADDPMLDLYISTSRSIVENAVGPLCPQTWIQYEREWPSGNVLSLKKPRVTSIVSVKYRDEDGVESTYSSSNYSLDSYNTHHPQIVLKQTSCWPTDSLYEVNPISVTFVCGYSSVSSIPKEIKLCISMLVGYMYENREADSKSFPSGVMDFLLANYRYRG